MRLTIHQNLSDRIAADIEKRIRNGTFVPERKMPSIRELADYYKVSVQAINTAVDKLQAAELLVSRPRIGLFVNPKHLLPPQKRFVILRSKGPAIGYDYLGDLLRLHDPELYPEVQLQTRALPKEERLSVPGELSYNPILLNYELDQIEAGCPDCLFVLLPHLKRAEVKRIASLPFPVVFVGDFDNGDFDGLVYNSIRERTSERGGVLIQTAVNIGAKHICMCGERKECYYVKQLYAGACEAADAAGIRFHYEEFRTGNLRPDVLDAYLEEVLPRMIRAYQPDVIVADSLAEMEPFLRCMEKIGCPVGEKIKFITNTNHLFPNIIMITEDYVEFAVRASRLIRGLTEKQIPFGIAEISGSIRRDAIQLGPKVSSCKAVGNC